MRYRRRCSCFARFRRVFAGWSSSEPARWHHAPHAVAYLETGSRGGRICCVHAGNVRGARCARLWGAPALRAELIGRVALRAIAYGAHRRSAPRLRLTATSDCGTALSPSLALEGRIPRGRQMPCLRVATEPTVQRRRPESSTRRAPCGNHRQVRANRIKSTRPLRETAHVVGEACSVVRSNGGNSGGRYIVKSPNTPEKQPTSGTEPRELVEGARNGERSGHAQESRRTAGRIARRLPRRA